MKDMKVGSKVRHKRTKKTGEVVNISTVTDPGMWCEVKWDDDSPEDWPNGYVYHCSDLWVID